MNNRETEEIAALIEAHGLQLAAIMTASIQNTETTVKDRIGKDNPFWTQAYEDVCRAVDREMTLRVELETANKIVTAQRAELESAKANEARLTSEHRKTYELLLCKLRDTKAANARMAAALHIFANQFRNAWCKSSDSSGDIIAEAERIATNALKDSTALRDLLGPTVAWIERFPCPECDGSGSKYDGNGNPCQCQFCFERQQELARLRAVMQGKG